MIQVFNRELLNKAWFLAFIPTVLFGFFFVRNTNEFNIVVEKAKTTSDQIFYIDLNGDGVSERIQAGKGYAPFNFVAIQDNEQLFHEQWNVPDHFEPSLSNLFFGDIDRDKKKEIYVFTIQGIHCF